MNYGYENKNCIVTGASSGIGKEVTKLLVDLKANVYVLDLNDCNIEGIKKFIKVNLANKEEIDKAFNELPDKIDSFFGIAGLSGSKTDYITTFNCDYTSNFYITEKYLKQRQIKSICYVSSTAGLNWLKYKKEQDKILNAKSWEEIQDIIKSYNKYAGGFAYMYAKRCLSQYTELLASQEKNIRVNAVLPGSTNTGMKEEFEKMAGGEEALLKETGIAHRLATSKEMAYPIVFLNSALASFISGINLCVDYADHCLKELKIKKDREDVPATNKLILSIGTKAMKK